MNETAHYEMVKQYTVCLNNPNKTCIYHFERRVPKIKREGRKKAELTMWFKNDRKNHYKAYLNNSEYLITQGVKRK